VLVCTAAGREGINLQHARILFNFDLPWNPMDMEQRIGRIHRYGQNHTAQVYNLVLSDTIEGRIFLLLEEKLTEIAQHGRQGRRTRQRGRGPACADSWPALRAAELPTASTRRRFPTPS
jgi:superfamily II DNA/RNA helicase